MEIELGIWLWRCETTQKTFEAPYWSGDWSPYGSNLMYARNGEMFHWNLFDGSFDECYNITKWWLYGNSEPRQSVPIYEICGICCDPASDGSILQSNPYCPYCDICNARILKRSTPAAKIYRVEDNVTHTNWNSLTDTEKEQLVLAAMLQKELIRKDYKQPPKRLPPQPTNQPPVKAVKSKSRLQAFLHALGIDQIQK